MDPEAANKHVLFARSILTDLRLLRAREMIMIAASRTGTNYLCATLNALPGTLGLHEIFGASGSFGLSKRRYLLPYFSKLLRHSIANQRDEHLIRFFRDEPKRGLAELARVAAIHGERLLSYKVFPSQVSPAIMAEILAERRPAVLFVVRERLPSYISSLKANAAGHWVGVDTSGIEVSGDLRQFLNWASPRDQWYAQMRQAVVDAGLPNLTLSYERHIDTSREELIATLLDALRKLGLEALPPPSVPPDGAYFKQDRTGSLFGKLANGAEFEKTLLKAGKLDYATTSPLAEHIWTGP